MGLETKKCHFNLQHQRLQNIHQQDWCILPRTMLRSVTLENFQVVSSSEFSSQDPRGKYILYLKSNISWHKMNLPRHGSTGGEMAESSPPPPLFWAPFSPQPGFGSITLLQKLTPHFKNYKNSPPLPPPQFQNPGSAPAYKHPNLI